MKTNSAERIEVPQQRLPIRLRDCGAVSRSTRGLLVGLYCEPALPPFDETFSPGGGVCLP
jgi:hypothetical protein